MTRVKIYFHSGFDLGRYPTAEEAHAAYLRAANHHFGEFARAG